MHVVLYGTTVSGLQASIRHENVKGISLVPFLLAMDVDNCTDSRGIRRGACTDPTCRCPSYNGGPDKKRCIKCAHPPGKHQHLDNPSANMGTPCGTTINKDTVKFVHYIIV